LAEIYLCLTPVIITKLRMKTPGQDARARSEAGGSLARLQRLCAQLEQQTRQDPHMEGSEGGSAYQGPSAVEKSRLRDEVGDELECMRVEICEQAAARANHYDMDGADDY
jgi:hypothetical protein